MTAHPIRPRIPYFVESEIYVGGREPEHPVWLHVALFLIPVLCGLVAYFLGNYWQ